jgi:hypothetical protein
LLNSLGKEKAEDIVENDLNQKGGKEKKLGGSGEKRKKPRRKPYGIYTRQNMIFRTKLFINAV